MPIVRQEEWDNYVKINDDPYGGCCVNVARRVMELLDAPEHSEPLRPGYNPDTQTPHGLICKADNDIDAGGITGFMAGCVADMVSLCHSRGEEFRKAWNAQYGVDEEAEGVVNPALITIDVPDGKTPEEVITEAAEKAGYEVLDKDQVLKHFGIEKGAGNGEEKDQRDEGVEHP